MPYVCAPLSTLMSRTGCMLRFVRGGPLGMRGRSQLVSNGNGSPWASAGLLHLQISGRTARAGSLGRQSSVGGEQGRGAGPPGHDAGAQLLLLPASARRALASADGAANGGRERGQEIWRRRCILLNGIPIGTVRQCPRLVCGPLTAVPRMMLDGARRRAPTDLSAGVCAVVNAGD